MTRDTQRASGQQSSASGRIISFLRPPLARNTHGARAPSPSPLPPPPLHTRCTHECARASARICCSHGLLVRKQVDPRSQNISHADRWRIAKKYAISSARASPKSNFAIGAIVFACEARLTISLAYLKQTANATANYIFFSSRRRTQNIHFSVLPPSLANADRTQTKTRLLAHLSHIEAAAGRGRLVSERANERTSSYITSRRQQASKSTSERTSGERARRVQTRRGAAQNFDRFKAFCGRSAGKVRAAAKARARKINRRADRRRGSEK